MEATVGENNIFKYWLCCLSLTFSTFNLVISFWCPNINWITSPETLNVSQVILDFTMKYSRFFNGEIFFLISPEFFSNFSETIILINIVMLWQEDYPGLHCWCCCCFSKKKLVLIYLLTNHEGKVCFRWIFSYNYLQLKIA